MAHFALYKKSVKNYASSKVASISMIVPEEMLIVLWGGGPPGADPLTVTTTPPNAAEVVELPQIDSINRRFRIIAKDMGQAKLVALWGLIPWATLPLDIGIGPLKNPPRILTDLEYDGTRLHWPSNGKTYKATSGLPADPSKPADPDWRQSQYSCVKDHGPVPEGTYTFSTAVEAKKGLVHVSDWSTCTLSPGAPIQKIPRGADAQEPRAGGQNCEPYWANWGTNRVRLEPKDSKTRLACNPGRSGFYLHDSTKGYSHGCIEVEPRFFTDLYAFAKTSKGKRLSLGVIYRRQVTQGGTKVP